jgi:hypothetical protein
VSFLLYGFQDFVSQLSEKLLNAATILLVVPACKDDSHAVSKRFVITAVVKLVYFVDLINVLRSCIHAIDEFFVAWQWLASLENQDFLLTSRWGLVYFFGWDNEESRNLPLRYHDPGESWEIEAKRKERNVKRLSWLLFLTNIK